MERLHNSSDIETTLNEMGSTLSEQSRKRFKLENQTKRTNSSDDSTDEEIERSIAMKNGYVRLK